MDAQGFGWERLPIVLALWELIVLIAYVHRPARLIDSITGIRINIIDVHNGIEK